MDTSTHSEVQEGACPAKAATLTSLTHVVVFGLTIVACGVILSNMTMGLSTFVSPWGCTATLAVVAVWLLVDNYTLYLDIQDKADQCAAAASMDSMNRRYITSLSTQLQYLGQDNLRLSRKLADFNRVRLANIHWSLLHHKTMGTYYMRKLDAQNKLNMVRKASSENALVSMPRLSL